MYINDCNGTELATLSLQVAPKQGSTWNQQVLLISVYFFYLYKSTNTDAAHLYRVLANGFSRKQTATSSLL